jgi:hypothetical protein
MNYAWREVSMKLVVNVWPKTGRHVREAKAQIWESFN